MQEQKYEFRRRLSSVHQPDRRNEQVVKQSDEVEVNDAWRIVISDRASAVVFQVAKDLQDYLLVSMHVSVRIVRASDIEMALEREKNVIVLANKKELVQIGKTLEVPRSYRLVVTAEQIIICGHDDRGVGQGSYFIEDLMNFRESPLIKIQDEVRAPLFSPRMIHSGWGLDQFPEQHLNAMAHAGIDAVLVFVKDADCTPNGYKDFNHLIDKAELYGLDVYAYSFLVSRKHPDEAYAKEYYEGTYGKLFKACPRFKGVILVGESCEFPSKDPNTTGMLRLDWPEDKVRTKPSPGWWPCVDYPEWLTMLENIIHEHNEEAEIVFWTYNWGWAPEEERLRLIRSLPEGITLQATFEMFEQIEREGVNHVCVDYTLSFAGPGRYFKSEAEAAHERGLKLYTMSNTGGLTWDIGVIPYEPFPGQWMKRHQALLNAQEQWGLSGLMESHHFGWWPSFISELTKWTYWSPSPEPEEILKKIAHRDFGDEAASYVLQAWQEWSEAIEYYIPTNEDQYGPFRIGPSYPLVFKKEVKIPAAWHAMFGNSIVFADYKPLDYFLDDIHQSPGAVRIEVEIRSLTKMMEKMQQGNALLEKALALTPKKKRADGEKMLGLGRFISLSVQTTIHVKQWWKLKQRLFLESDREKAEAILTEMENLAFLEIANAEKTIPLVEADSRLGWEPSMDYMTDREHLHWKINQVQTVLDHEIADYRKMLNIGGRK